MTKFAFIALMFVCLMLAGCAAVGLATHKVFGPPAVPAKFTLDKVPTLILVENYRRGSQMQFDSESLSRALIAEFEKKELVPLVDADRVYLLRDNDPKAFRSMKVQEIGRQCGAEQVLYVDLLDLSVGMQQARNDAQGGASARVKVVSAKTGLTLWPQDAAEGYPVSYYVKVDTSVRPSSYESVRGKVMTGTSDRIGRLFYKYKPDEVPE